MTPTRKQLMERLRNILPNVLTPYTLATVGEAFAETCKLADELEAKKAEEAKPKAKPTPERMVHIFDSSQTCDYCGVAAENTQRDEICTTRNEKAKGQ